MHLEKFVNSQNGKILMSILMGLGLATMFRQMCKGKRCRIKSAPPHDDVNGKIYKYNGKCYEFRKLDMDCKSGMKTIKTT